MADWPDIEDPSGLRESPQKGQIKSDFEAGYVQSRPKFTRTRKRFELSWDAMSNSDKETLETFFDDNLGDTFTWDNPISTASDPSHTVRFVNDSLEFSYRPHNYWQISIELEEQ